jgi:hypothetical protein
LTDYSSLSLELIPTLSEDKKILLKYRVVYGNDPHPKHNPSQSGHKSQEYQLEVLSTLPVKEIKAQLLSHYLATLNQEDLKLERGEANRFLECPMEKRLENLRIRLTNWAGECGELMEEVNQETKDLEDYSLEEISFNPTYLLHLEEGKYPVKGFLTVKVGCKLSAPPLHSSHVPCLPHLFPSSLAVAVE